MVKTFKTLLLAGACAAALGRGAQANVLYSFRTITATNSDGPRTLPLALFYDLTSATVRSGAFTLKGSGNGGANPDGSGGPPAFTGDGNGFSLITIADSVGDLERVTPSYLYGAIDTTLTFDAAGNIASSYLNFSGISVAATLSGSGATATGHDISDDSICSSPSACTVTGVWSRMGDPYAVDPAPVPEPTSFALLGAGLLGLGMIRRRTA